MTDQNKNENAESNDQDTVEVDAVESETTDTVAEESAEATPTEAAPSDKIEGQGHAGDAHEAEPAPEEDNSDGGKLIKVMIALTVILGICWMALQSGYKRAVSERSQNLAAPTSFAPAVHAQAWNEERVGGYGREPVGEVEEGQEPSAYRYFVPTQLAAELLMASPEALAGDASAATVDGVDAPELPEAPELENLLGETTETEPTAAP